MKSNPTATILNWALAIALIVLFVGGVQYFFRTREVRSLQIQMSNFQNKQVLANTFVNEVMEYSKRNPAIDSVLESAGLKLAKAVSTGTNKSATK
jgi:hypothetical protein